MDKFWEYRNAIRGIFQILEDEVLNISQDATRILRWIKDTSWPRFVIFR